MNCHSSVRQTAEVIISSVSVLNISSNHGAVSNDDDDRILSDDAEQLPPEQDWIRRSFWVKTLQNARQRKTWTRVNRLYTEKTAAQLASDLRSAHHRDVKNLRLRGVLPGDRWDTRWNASPEGPDGQFSIWIRFLGTDGTE